MLHKFKVGDKVRFIGLMGPPEGTEGIVVADHGTDNYPLDVRFDGDWGQWCIEHYELESVYNV